MNDKNLIKKFISKCKKNNKKEINHIVKDFIRSENLSYKDFYKLSYVNKEHNKDFGLIEHMIYNIGNTLYKNKRICDKVDVFIRIMKETNKDLIAIDKKYIYQDILRNTCFIDFFHFIEKEKINKASIFFDLVIDKIEIEDKHSLDIDFLVKNYNSPFGNSLLSKILENIKDENLHTLIKSRDSIKSIKDNSFYKEFHFKRYLEEIDRNIKKKKFLEDLE